jgi:hypothetical protein
MRRLRAESSRARLMEGVEPQARSDCTQNSTFYPRLWPSRMQCQKIALIEGIPTVLTISKPERFAACSRWKKVVDLGDVKAASAR